MSSESFPLVKTKSRRRWEKVDDQRRTLFKVKSNQIRLVEQLGYTIPEREQAIIVPRTYDEENAFYSSDFLGRIMPEMYTYHQQLIRENREETPKGGAMSDRFLMGAQYYKTDPVTGVQTDFLIVIFMEDKEGEVEIPVATINTHIGTISERFKIIPKGFHLMYILPKPITRSGRSDIISGGAFELVILEDHQLYVNAVDHVLNQTFIRLGSDTVEKVMSGLHKSKSALPKIDINDPNAIISGWTMNDVIMVVRRDIMTGGPEITMQYRVVNASAQDLIKRA